MLDPNQHSRLRDLFLQACDLPQDRQGEFVDAECGDDPELAGELRKLLAFDLEGEADLAMEVEPREPQLPESIGAYRIRGLIGEGGMGRVYLAEQERPRREVACKILRFGQLSVRARQRFGHEAEVLGRLQHPGIAQVIEFGHAEVYGEDLPFLVMELVRGAPLVEYAQRAGMGREARIELFLKVCAAVGHAHECGIIHRDLKPANILVQQDQPKVLDFGISRMGDGGDASLTVTGQLVGTLAYMSPEQLSGDSAEISSRSDVYSLGVVLFELLAGRLPMDPEGMPLPAAISHLQTGVRPSLSSFDPQLRGDLETIVARCLEIEPVRRYASTSELAADLQRHLLHEPILARPATAFYQLSRFARRHRAAVAFAVLFSLALIIGLVTSLVYAQAASRQSAVADRSSYRANVAAASAMLGSDPLLARRHLEDCPEHLRGFEWQLLDAQLQPASPRGGGAQAVGGAEVQLLRIEGGDLLLGRAAPGSAAHRVRTGLPTITTAECSADGQIVVVQQSAVAPLLVFTARGIKLCEIPIPERGQRPGFALDARGTRLISYSSAGPLRVHALPSGRLERVIDRSTQLASVSPDGCWACLRGGGTQVLLVDLRSGAVTESSEISWSHGRPVFSPRGDLVAVASVRSATVFRVPSLVILDELNLQENRIAAMAFDPSGRFLASSDTQVQTGTTRVHDLQRLVPARVLLGGGAGSLVFAQDSRILVAAGPEGVRLLPVADPRSQELRGHRSFVYHCTFSPDGGLLASAGWDRSICIWEPRSGRLLHRSRLRAGVRPGGLAFDAEGENLLWIGVERQRTWRIALLDSEEQQELELAEYWRRGAGTSTSLQRGSHAGHKKIYLDQGRLRLVCNRQAVVCYRGARQHELFRGDALLSGLGLDQARRRLAIGGIDGRVWLLQLSPAMMPRGAPVLVAEQSGTVYDLEFSPDGRRLAIGSVDSSIDLIDLQSLSLVASLAGHDGYVHDLEFSADGQQLVSASGDRSLRIWDLRNRARALQLQGEREVAAVVAELRRIPAAAARFAALRRKQLDASHYQAVLRLLIATQD